MTSSTHVEPLQLDYESAEADVRRRRNPMPLLIVSIVCLLGPWMGLVLRAGLLFLAGLPLSVIGIVAASVAFLISRRTAADFVLPALLTFGNALSLYFFFNLFFIRGLC